MKKRVISLLLVAAMALGLVACGSQETTSTDSAAPAAEGAVTEYNIGVLQLVQHVALDAATEGFMAALNDKAHENPSVKFNFDVQNAAGEAANCSTIANQFATAKVDLMLANATAPLQACQAATADIPVLGTSVTDYATALDLSDFTGTTGMNISGTSDCAPLDQQASMIKELFPDVKKVGLVFCSAEPNSIYQADTVAAALKALGVETEVFSFSDSNDIASVVTAACAACEVLYVPTDNTAASNAEVINNICEPAGIPVVAGEEGICKGCGIATLSISYYDLGYQTGLMAYEILVNGADVSTMPIAYASATTKEYMASRCETLGISVPSDYAAIEE